MATAELEQVRSNFVQALLGRIEEDRFPSVTMLNMVESLLHPDEVPDYVQQLLDRVEADPYPSIDMLKRIQRLV